MVNNKIYCGTPIDKTYSDRQLMLKIANTHMPVLLIILNAYQWILQDIE
jgi:hypothetical protein